MFYRCDFRLKFGAGFLSNIRFFDWVCRSLRVSDPEMLTFNIEAGFMRVDGSWTVCIGGDFVIRYLSDVVSSVSGWSRD